MKAAVIHAYGSPDELKFEDVPDPSPGPGEVLIRTVATSINPLDVGHKDLGEKTMLFLIDGLYGNDNVDGPPHRKWKMPPFDGAWPNSIFMSFEGVAIDSVASISSLQSGLIFRISRTPITTCANLPWLTIHLRKRSMIRNAMAFGAAALVYMSIGTTEPIRSTRAISERRAG